MQPRRLVRVRWESWRKGMPSGVQGPAAVLKGQPCGLTEEGIEGSALGVSREKGPALIHEENGNEEKLQAFHVLRRGPAGWSHIERVQR